MRSRRNGSVIGVLLFIVVILFFSFLFFPEQHRDDLPAGMQFRQNPITHEMYAYSDYAERFVRYDDKYPY